MSLLGTTTYDVGHPCPCLGPRPMMLDIHVFAWDNHKNVAWFSRLMGSQFFPFDNWMYIVGKYIKTYM
jgi:roadblock/LC7 domain-containing protein